MAKINLSDIIDNVDWKELHFDSVDPDIILHSFDSLYKLVIDGIPNVCPPIQVLAEDYLQKNGNVRYAAKSLTHYQIAKCTTSGFVNNLPGGFLVVPATTLELGSVLYIQMRMVAGLAYMGGFDVYSDQVKTFVYVCLVGLAVVDPVKKAGVKFGNKFAAAMLKKVPTDVLKKINRAVGFRFITKFGEKGILNLGKVIPVVGGLIGGSVDLVDTKIVADRAYKLFVCGDISVITKSKSDDDILVDIPYTEVN